MRKNKPLRSEYFEELFLTHYQTLFLVGFRLCANRELTKDVLQSFFLELWEKRDRLGHVEHWNAYLRKAFYHRMLQEVQKNRLPTEHLSEGTNKISTPSYETLLINFQQKKSQKQDLENAMKELPDQQKEMLKLRFHEGWSYEEIAANTGKSKQTVYNQIYEAIKKLRKSLMVFLFYLN
ncbi:MAG: RNA polymerase sigma factor [Saprospiraceae bacterium]